MRFILTIALFLATFSFATTAKAHHRGYKKYNKYQRHYRYKRRPIIKKYVNRYYCPRRRRWVRYNPRPKVRTVIIPRWSFALNF